MTGDKQRGRIIIWVISAAIVLPQVFTVIASLVVGDTRTAAMSAIRLSIAIAMSYLMWRGYSAARAYLAFSLFVGAALILVGPGIGLLVRPLGVGYMWAAWALWKSPHLEAYIDAQEEARNPILSIRDGDGV